MATRNDRVQCTWMTSFSSVQYTSSGTPRVFPQVKKQVHLEKDARSSDVLHFVCFGVETWNCMHFLVILYENFVKRWRTALYHFYICRNTYFIFRDSKMCTFEVLLFCVWCLDNWSRILSGNTFSMARLNTLQFHLTLTPLFTATHTLFFLSFTIFNSWSVIGVYGLFSCDPRFMAHIDSPWLVKFPKMANINFRESWFTFFLLWLSDPYLNFLNFWNFSDPIIEVNAVVRHFRQPYAQQKIRGKKMHLLGMDTCPSLNDIMEIRCNKCTRSEQGYDF